MKRFLSHFKPRLSLLLFVIASAIITGCTLHMDDPDDLRVLRTEEGYLEEEVIELPDGNGTISYKYNQKTIAITDEVEEYVVKVESDSIVYFVSSIPDYYLPEVGEMMTSSFREKFPDAFCHRCIERTEVNGLYRCVFTKCSLAEAFDKLVINHVQPKGVTINGKDYELTTEQFDSIMGDADSPEVMEARTRADDGSNLDEKRVPFTRQEVNLPKLECFGKAATNNLLDFTGTASCGGKLVIEGYADMVGDTEKGTLRTTFDFRGSLNLWFKIEGAYNVTLTAIDDVKITGLSFDFFVVGLKAGLFCKPYININTKVSGQINVGWTFRISCVSDQPDFSADALFNITNKGCSSPSVTFNGVASSLGVEAGLDIYLKFGADLFKIGADVSVGVKFYGAVDVPIDLEKYNSADAFVQENENFPLYGVIYMKGVKKIKGIETGAMISSTPMIVVKNLPIPIMPEIEKDDSATNFYCKDRQKKTYYMKYKLRTEGLLGFLFDFVPYVHIYDADGNLLKEIQIAANLVKNGETTWTDRDEILQINTPYIVQFGLKRRWYWLPLRDIKYEIEDPGCFVQYGEIVKSIDAEKLSSEGSRFEPDYFSHQKFRYQYIIDVQMQINHPKSFHKWGFEMKRTDGGAPFYFERTISPEWQKLAVAYPTVRFYFYTNKEYDFNRKPVDIYLKISGRYGLIVNGKKLSMRYIDDKWKAVSLLLAYNNATSHGPLTGDEIEEFQSDPDNFDMLQDNMTKNPNFLYETHTQTYTSRGTNWFDTDDEVYVVGEVR